MSHFESAVGVLTIIIVFTLAVLYGHAQAAELVPSAPVLAACTPVIKTSLSELAIAAFSGWALAVAFVRGTDRVFVDKDHR